MRTSQAEMVDEIVGKRMRADEKYLIAGDMNCGAEAEQLYDNAEHR